MCDTCPAHIPGPGEVGSGVLGAAVAAALTRPGRRVMFWGLAVPMVLGIIVYTLGWWLVPIAFGVLTLAAGVLLAVRRLLHRHVLLVAPPSLQKRAALPAPRPARARRRRALPAPQRAIEAAKVPLAGVVLPSAAGERIRP